jgi:thiol-disulfide isomerase/thioredoxin
MKPIFTLLLTFVWFTSVAQYVLKTDSVCISGKVNGYTGDANKANSIQFIINDFAFGDQLTYRAKLKSDGTYKTAFLKTGTQDVYIDYDDNLETIIVSPGDHMQISFDTGNLKSTLTFSGDNKQTNRDLRAYSAAVDKESVKLYGSESVSRFRAMAASEKDNLPDAHKKFLTNRLNKDEAYLNAYIKKLKLTKTFIKWAKADLQAEYLSNLMRYTWLHVSYNHLSPANFKLPDSYFDFTKNVLLKSPDLAISSNYSLYLNDYENYFADKALGTPRNVDDLIILLSKQPAGFAKDAMLSTLLYRLVKAKGLESVKTNLNLFKASVSNPVFKNRVLDAYNLAVEQQKNYQLTADMQIKATPKSEADSLLNKIVAKYPNKVIYVDFWATWCGPCRDEMPNSKTLRESYANKDVVFLYLGVLSDENSWKAMIAELDIKGEHYLLNKNEYAALSEKFQINGIPRYLLIDKKGKVASDNAKRPGDKMLKPEIDALLAVK